MQAIKAFHQQRRADQQYHRQRHFAPSTTNKDCALTFPSPRRCWLRARAAPRVQDPASISALKGIIRTARPSRSAKGHRETRSMIPSRWNRSRSRDDREHSRRPAQTAHSHPRWRLETKSRATPLVRRRPLPKQALGQQLADQVALGPLPARRVPRILASAKPLAPATDSRHSRMRSGGRTPPRPTCSTASAARLPPACLSGASRGSSRSGLRSSGSEIARRHIDAARRSSPRWPAPTLAPGFQAA